MSSLVQATLVVILPNGEEFDLVVEREVACDPNYKSETNSEPVPAYFFGPPMIQNLNELVSALEEASAVCEDEFIESFEEDSVDFDDEDEEEDETVSDSDSETRFA
jgi:hypothetical protein